MIRLRLHLVVNRCRGRDLVVAHHHLLVPRQDAVADLMSFQPPMFRLRDRVRFRSLRRCARTMLSGIAVSWFFHGLWRKASACVCVMISHFRHPIIFPQAQVFVANLVEKRGVNGLAGRHIPKINQRLIHRITNSLFSLVTSSSTRSFLPGCTRASSV